MECLMFQDNGKTMNRYNSTLSKGTSTVHGLQFRPMVKLGVGKVRL